MDVDAIQSLEDYLDYGFKKIGKPMQKGEPLFLNSRNLTIPDYWIRQSFKSGSNKKMVHDAVISIKNRHNQNKEVTSIDVWNVKL